MISALSSRFEVVSNSLFSSEFIFDIPIPNVAKNLFLSFEIYFSFTIGLGSFIFVELFLIVYLILCVVKIVFL